MWCHFRHLLFSLYSLSVFESPLCRFLLHVNVSHMANCPVIHSWKWINDVKAISDAQTALALVLMAFLERERGTRKGERERVSEPASERERASFPVFIRQHTLVFHTRSQIKGHIPGRQYHLQIKARPCSVGEQMPWFPQMDACLGLRLISKRRAMDFVASLAHSGLPCIEFTLLSLEKDNALLLHVGVFLCVWVYGCVCAWKCTCVY